MYPTLLSILLGYGTYYVLHTKDGQQNAKKIVRHAATCERVIKGILRSDKKEVKESEIVKCTE